MGLDPRIPNEEPHEPFFQELWQASQGVVVLGVLAGFAAHVVGGVSMLLSRGQVAGQTVAPVAGTVAAPGEIIIQTPPITLGDPIVDVILACIVTGIVVYTLLVAVCSSEWVKKKKKIKDCWHKKKWYNPFDWVRILVCVVKWVVRKILEVICKWKEIITIVLTIACIVVGIILVA